MTKIDLTNLLLKKVRLKLNATEKILFETNLLIQICKELSKFFHIQQQTCEQLIKNRENKEMKHMNIQFMPEMIKDILSTKEYTLAGIAIHTNIPEDVLCEIAARINTNPTFETSRKIFELHISVRKKLYDEVMRKVVLEYLKDEDNVKK